MARHISAGKVLLCVAIVSVLGFVLWRSSGSHYINLPPTAAGPWVAFGDSLTEGYGASAETSYPAQLGKRLGIPIQNLGVSGETSAQGLARLPQIEELNPRVVLLCFGGNDVLQNMRRDEMISNLGVMIDRLHGHGSFVVLIGVRGASIVGDRNSSAFKHLAKEKHVFFIPDILDGVLGTPSLMSDYVHPNEAGYAKIAERIEKKLNPVLSKLR
jgi:lysophospholipase L1-like esterase